MASDPDNFRVSPSLQGLPQLSATPVQNAAGEQMQRLGQSIQGAGQTASAIYTDVLREQNAVRVTDALTKLTEKRNQYTYDPEYGWTALRGVNALERPNGASLDEEFGGLLDDDAERLAAGLGNDAQRREFTARAQAMSLDFRQRVGAHAAQENQTYQLETYAGMAQTGQNQLSVARTPEERAEAQAMIGTAAARIFDLKGTPKEAQQDVLRGLMSPGHLAQLNRLLEAETPEALEQAEQYFNEARDQITVAEATRFEGALIEQRSMIDAANIGDALFEGTQAQNAAAAPEQVGMPVLGAYRATGKFGDDRGTHRHGGIDWAMPVGTPVRAGASGVARVKKDPNGYGTYVDLKMDDGTTLRMAHLSGAEVEDGQRVNKGDVIARSGNTGRSTGPHLHYEVIGPDGAKRDPVEWHQGRPTATPASGGRKTKTQALEELYAMDLPRRTEQLAEERITRRYAAQDAAETEAKEELVSAAYAEIDTNGALSNATQSRLVAAGLGAQLPGLRSFARSTQERASGGDLSDEASLDTYAAVREAIVAGEVRSVADLTKYKPGLSTSLYRSLVDDITKPQGSSLDVTDRALSVLKPEIDATRLFVDEDGKSTPETDKEYRRFRGAVYRQVEFEQKTNGGRLPDARLREIVLGMTAQRVISGPGGDMPMRAYNVTQMYSRIDPTIRTRLYRQLLRNSPTGVSQGQVVSEYLRQYGSR
jgi:murein DD-endopeptidase MepM/ murein hydrolase activator NlpD